MSQLADAGCLLLLAPKVAGCTYRVACTPSAFSLSVGGYSEKLPRLLDAVTSRIESLIAEMKEGDMARPTLAGLFRKAKENLLRQTKNYIFEAPYETGSYNNRMVRMPCYYTPHECE